MPHLVLLVPAKGQFFLQLPEAHSIRLVPRKNRIDDIRRERCEPQDAADLSAVDAGGRCQIFKALVVARCELLLPAIRFGQGGNERAIPFAFGCGLTIVAMGEHHLADVATIESNKDSHNNRIAW